MTGLGDEGRVPRPPDRISETGCALCDEVAARSMVDEPIHPEDLEACRRHEETCDRCRALRALGPQILGEPKSVGQAYLERVLQTAQDRIHGLRRRSVARWMAVAAGLALFGLALVFRYPGDKTRHSRHRAESKTPTLTLVSGCLRRAGQDGCIEPNQAVRGGDEMTSASDQVRLERGDDLVVIALRDTKTSFRMASQGVFIHLLDGTVAVRLTPGRKVAVTVRTDRAMVRVKGTVFSVHRDARDVVVAVAAGRVEVTFGPRDSTVVLESGQAFSVHSASRTAQIDTDDLDLLRFLASESHRPYKLPESRRPAGRRGLLAPTRGGDRGFVRAGVRSERKSAKIRKRADRRSAKQAVPRSRTTSSIPTSPSISNLALLKKAQACRRAGNWSCALATYQSLVDGKGGSPVASALVAMGQIELTALSRFSAALRHFDLYLNKRPNGALAAEALYGKARALGALGRRREEKRVLKRFLSKFPNTILAGAVRRRLESLRHAH